VGADADITPIIKTVGFVLAMCPAEGAKRKKRKIGWLYHGIGLDSYCGFAVPEQPQEGGA